MKFLSTLFTYVQSSRKSQRNLGSLFRFMAALGGLVVLYSVLFHVLMKHEGQEHSWVTGFYWTFTVMSTLGFGDITFSSDLGRMFSIVVLLSGMISLLIMMPFVFIKFFYEPWMEAQAAARAPKKLPERTSGHVILTHSDPVSDALIKKLKQYNMPYVLVVRDLTQALQLHDRGINVIVGELDHPRTYQNAQLKGAALVAATSTDVVNTNVAFTVRELSATVPVITTANTEAAEDVLRLAGSSNVLRLGEMMGQFLARRTIGGDARAHVIGRFDQLLISEATAAGTPLVGKTLDESRLRDKLGMTVVGVWERGNFAGAGPNTRITSNTVLVLAGSLEQLRRYNELFCIYHVATAPVIIVGGGRVGRATSRWLAERKRESVIIEQRKDRVRDPKKYIQGNAAELEILESAGIKEAPSIIITTHDDDTNIFLTIYSRKLRPDIQIIARATLERNVSTLHRAGADFVMSYASMGANAIFNLLKKSDILMVAEGLNVFRVKVPSSLANRTIAESAIRAETGCSVIAVNTGSALEINPAADRLLEEGSEIVLIGSVEAEDKFLKEHGE